METCPTPLNIIDLIITYDKGAMVQFRATCRQLAVRYRRITATILGILIRRDVSLVAPLSGVCHKLWRRYQTFKFGLHLKYEHHFSDNSNDEYYVRARNNALLGKITHASDVHRVYVHKWGDWETYRGSPFKGFCITCIFNYKPRENNIRPVRVIRTCKHPLDEHIFDSTMSPVGDPTNINEKNTQTLAGYFALGAT